MPLTPGTKLGPCEIAAQIGAGGMGEVYKATDTRLNRTVAVKVLPARFSADPEMKRRFDREAQMGLAADAGGAMSSSRMRTTLVLAVLVGAGALALAQAPGGELRITPAEVAWPAPTAGGVGTSGVSGVQTVMLKGDPGKPGVYSMLLRVGPNTRIEAHSHADDRVATVISGTWYFGYGREFNEGALKELPVGSVYTEPPNANHFAATRGEGAIVQITGYGPSGTTYVDPANDPNRSR